MPVKLDERTENGTLFMKAPLEVRFYRTASGTEPVRVWLKEQRREVKVEIGADIERVQWRWPVSKPLVDGLGGGLFEVRSKVRGVNYRVLFCVKAGFMVLLHGFVKKARTAPADIEIGRARLKELES